MRAVIFLLASAATFFLVATLVPPPAVNSRAAGGEKFARVGMSVRCEKDGAVTYTEDMRIHPLKARFVFSAFAAGGAYIPAKPGDCEMLNCAGRCGCRCASENCQTEYICVCEAPSVTQLYMHDGEACIARETGT